MNSEKVLNAAERIEGNTWMIRRFLHDREVGSVEATIEVLGRLSIIEAKVAEIRTALIEDESGHPDNVHVLGNRGDAA